MYYGEVRVPGALTLQAHHHDPKCTVRGYLQTRFAQPLPRGASDPLAHRQKIRMQRSALASAARQRPRYARSSSTVALGFAVNLGTRATLPPSGAQPH